LYEGGGTGAAGHKMKVNCVKWVDENLIVTGGWDKTIKVWDVREPAPIRSIFGPYVAADSLDVQDGVILAGSNETSNQLAMFSFDDGKLFDYISWDDGNLQSPSPCKIYCAQFMKTTGEYVIAGGSGCNEIKIFDSVNAFQPVAQIKELSRAVFSCDFSNQGDMFAIGGGDGVVRVFNLVHDV
jgi:WD40 repeat protein